MYPSPETRDLLFTLLKAGLYPDFASAQLPPPDESRWREVYRTATEQGVAAIVLEGVQRLLAAGTLPAEAAPPRTLKLQWALNAERSVRLYERQRRVISRLAAFYREHGIPMMVLKGYGLSRCYPRPEQRPCGDIDIWLFGRQRQADTLLRQERHVRIDEDVHHHTTFRIEGVMVENHYDFLNVHAHPSNREIERLLKRYAERPGERVEIEGAEVLLPGADFNALFLLRHAASHFAAQDIGLRHVVDWALFVARYHDRIDWPALVRTARKMNMHRFLGCLHAISTDCLGLDAAKVPALERDARLERRVLDDILHPEFSEPPPRRGIVRLTLYRTRRWWANRWKHRIVYREGLARTFLAQLRSHLMKPRSLTR